MECLVQTNWYAHRDRGRGDSIRTNREGLTLLNSPGLLNLNEVQGQPSGNPPARKE